MSTIILNPEKSKKILHCVEVPIYLKSKNYYFPEFYAAAFVLRTALLEGADEINIEVKGMRPMKFTTKYVEEQVRKNPLLLKFSGLDREFTLAEKLLKQHEATNNGLYL